LFKQDKEVAQDIAESRSPEEIESYFNNNVQPILDEYLGFAYLCDQ
jgi:hypothetical protein